MDKNDIINYVMHTPHNTNRAVLSSMLNQLTEGGGGGSSDFSTAEVTIVANNASGSCIVPRCIEAGELAPEAPAMLDAIVSFENEEIVFNAVLYKGMAVADFASNRVTSVTGDAMWDEEDSSVYIMGNCTITVTDA